MCPTYSPDVKIRAVLDYKAGKNSQEKIAKSIGTNWTTLQRWIRQYDSFSKEIFYKHGYQHYSAELKEVAVTAYLAGEGSYESLCTKYKIRSAAQLERWVMQYNDSGRLKTSGTGGFSIMKNGRKTTLQERVEIAAHCIEHDHNYAATSVEYNISYQQARNYTIKYEQGGLEALEDRRGKKRPTDALSEIEKLKAELKLEQARRKHAEMEVSFLKKLNEIERRQD